MNKLASLGMAVALLGTLAAPISAYAYLSPDQVFGAGDLPSTRGGDDAVAAQQAAAASSRAAAQESLTSTDDEPQDSYVSSAAAASSLGLFDETVQYEKRQERMDAAAGDFGANALHSGAPLVTRSGPESMIAMAFLFVATFATLGFCYHRSRKLALASASR